MDHSLFGCLRSPHTSAQSLHPVIPQSPLTLHGRSNHVSYLDLHSSSPSCNFPEGEDNVVFGSPVHRGTLTTQQQQHPRNPQHPPGWTVPPQMPSPTPRHGVCLPSLEATAAGLCLGVSNVSDSKLGSCSGDPTEASCVSRDYSQQGLPSDDSGRRSNKGRSDNTGKMMMSIMFFIVSTHTYTQMTFRIFTAFLVFLKFSVFKDMFQRIFESLNELILQLYCTTIFTLLQRFTFSHFYCVLFKFFKCFN